MQYRRSALADRDLDDIWYRIASETASVTLANRVIGDITGDFRRLALFPGIGRVRDQDFGPGRRSWASDDYVIVYMVRDVDILILRVIHGRRDIAAILSGDAT